MSFGTILGTLATMFGQISVMLQRFLEHVGVLPQPVIVWSSHWHMSHGHRLGGHCPSRYIDIVGYWLSLQMVTSLNVSSESVLLCALCAVATNSSVLVICSSSDHWFHLG